MIRISAARTTAANTLRAECLHAQTPAHPNPSSIARRRRSAQRLRKRLLRSRQHVRHERGAALDAGGGERRPAAAAAAKPLGQRAHKRAGLEPGADRAGPRCRRNCDLAIGVRGEHDRGRIAQLRLQARRRLLPGREQGLKALKAQKGERPLK